MEANGLHETRIFVNFSGVSVMYVELQVENKRSNVKRLVVRSKAIIGRQSHCDIRVVSTEISREHCQIEIQSDGAVLIDLGSTNGTFLNRKRIDPHKATLLHDNDIILVGPACFVVHLVESRLAEETHRPGDETHISENQPELQLEADEAKPDQDAPEEKPPAAADQDEGPALELTEDLQDLLNADDDSSRSLLAGVTSDSDMEELSDDDAFDKYLKGL